MFGLNKKKNDSETESIEPEPSIDLSKIRIHTMQDDLDSLQEIDPGNIVEDTSFNKEEEVFISKKRDSKKFKSSPFFQKSTPPVKSPPVSKDQIKPIKPKPAPTKSKPVPIKPEPHLKEKFIPIKDKPAPKPELKPKSSEPKPKMSFEEKLKTLEIEIEPKNYPQPQQEEKLKSINLEKKTQDSEKKTKEKSEKPILVSKKTIKPPELPKAPITSSEIKTSKSFPEIKDEKDIYSKKTPVSPINITDENLDKEIHEEIKKIKKDLQEKQKHIPETIASEVVFKPKPESEIPIPEPEPEPEVKPITPANIPEPKSEIPIPEPEPEPEVKPITPANIPEPKSEIPSPESKFTPEIESEIKPTAPIPPPTSPQTSFKPKQPPLVPTKPPLPTPVSAPITTRTHVPTSIPPQVKPKPEIKKQYLPPPAQLEKPIKTPLSAPPHPKPPETSINLPPQQKIIRATPTITSKQQHNQQKLRQLQIERQELMPAEPEIEGEIKLNNGKFKKFIHNLVIILILLAIIGGGYYIWSLKDTVTNLIPDNLFSSDDKNEIINTTPDANILTKFFSEGPNYIPTDVETITADSMKQLLINTTSEVQADKPTVPIEFVFTDTNNNPVSFPIFSYSAGFNLPKKINSYLEEKFSLYIDNDNNNMRLGLKIEIKPNEVENLKNSIIKHETVLVDSFAPIYLDYPIEQRFKNNPFENGSYKNYNIKYLNLNKQDDLSLDYTFYDKWLIIGTSKNSIRAILDKLENSNLE